MRVKDEPSNSCVECARPRRSKFASSAHELFRSLSLFLRRERTPLNTDSRPPALFRTRSASRAATQPASIAHWLRAAANLNDSQIGGAASEGAPICNRLLATQATKAGCKPALRPVCPGDGLFPESAFTPISCAVYSACRHAHYAIQEPVMRIKEIREFRDAPEFKPFTLCLADGRA